MIKPCSRCKQQPRQSRHNYCKVCAAAYARDAWRNSHKDSPRVADILAGREPRNKHPANRMWQSARHRARQRNLEFSLDLRQIIVPETCPVLGIPLDRRDLQHTPSLDRIDPAKGYTHDNVAVISFRANSIKQDATADELKLVVAYVSRG